MKLSIFKEKNAKDVRVGFTKSHLRNKESLKAKVQTMASQSEAFLFIHNLNSPTLKIQERKAYFCPFL
jgi:hypothetical protein